MIDDTPSMKYCPICFTEYPDEQTTCPVDNTRLQAATGWKPGDVIRKYRIVEKLGAGGMGAVYKAIHVTFEETRALKVMHPAIAADPKFVQRFLREAKTARRLRHPNTVAVEDIDQADDGSLFIAMEFVDGPPLSDLIKAGGRLHPERALRIARSLASALQYAHAEGIVHRDIKPPNIFMATDPNGDDLPKLGDFGIVAVQDGSTLMTSQLLLSPTYAAPEQFDLASDEIDGRADLYSLGLVLYEMLTGELPFTSGGKTQWMLAKFTQVVPPPSGVVPELAAISGLDDVIAKLTAADRNLRFADATALLDAIAALQVPGAESEAPVLAPLEGRPVTPAALDPAPESATAVEQSTPAPATPEPPVATKEQLAADPSPQDRRVRGSLPWKAAIAAAGVLATVSLVWLLTRNYGGRKAEMPPDCAYTVSAPMVMIPPAGQQMKVPVGTAAACPWTATTDTPWLSITTASGKGNGEIVYTVAQNTGQYPRTGVINIGGQPHTVQQSADAPKQTACDPSISPGAVTANAPGVTGVIEVASSCAWSANSDSTWIQITGGAAAPGNGRVSYTVARNDSPVPRTGVIVIAGKVHRISQGGASSSASPVADCRYQFNPPAFNAAGPVPDGRVNIDTAPNCSWTANTNAAWISILSLPVGRGSGGLTFTVAANNAPTPRTGAITVGNSTFTITQAPGAEAPPADYSRIMKQANGAFGERNYNLAAQLARQALSVNASKPDAYDLLGHIDLYIAGNLSSAQQNMQAAIARGGKATFSVRHDHSGLTFAESCSGYLYIWSNKVVFASPVDRFEASKEEVKEAEPNKGWAPIRNNLGIPGHVFHIRITARNYNMTGTSSINKEEMNLIVALIGKK